MRLTEKELKELVEKGLVVLSDTSSGRALGKKIGAAGPKRSEHQEQVVFFNWVREHEHECPELKRVFAVPNGGARHIAVAAKMKAEGVRRGVPDILFPYQSRGHVGLAIEMKVKGGRTSEYQDEWIAHLRKEGWYAVVCHGSEAAIATLRWYLDGRV